MATLDYGAVLASSTTDGSYTTLARIVDFGESEDSLTKIKLSILANTTHKQAAGTIELADLPFTIEFEKTDFNTVRGYFTARSTRWWKITDVDGNIWKGRAFISKMTNVPKFGDDDRLKYKITLTPSDADWSFTAV